MFKKLWEKKWVKVVVVILVFSWLSNIFGLNKDEPVSKEKAAVVNTDPTPTVVNAEPTTTTNESKIEYEIITSEEYGIGSLNHSFRIVVDSNSSDEQLLWVLKKVDNKKYEEVTIWFYTSKKYTNGPYNVAMVERTGSKSPNITR